MLDFDAGNLRDWMAGVGLLRIVSETSPGRMRWQMEGGRYHLSIEEVPEDLPARAAAWIAEHKGAWSFGGLDNVNADCTPEFWRERALSASGLEPFLWSAVGSDGVRHRDGKKLQASVLEYAHGGGHQHWLASLRSFVQDPRVNAEAIGRILRGERQDQGETICRWDPMCERDHAYLDGDPAASSRKARQDVTINALAAIGLASCPSMPTRRGLVTPLVLSDGIIEWPVWTDALRTADLEGALLCGWLWPTMRSRRWNSGKLYCFSQGELREPRSSAG